MIVAVPLRRPTDDFDRARYEELLALVPEPSRSSIRQSLSEQPYQVQISEESTLLPNAVDRFR